MALFLFYGDGGVEEEEAVHGAGHCGVEPAQEGFVYAVEHEAVKVHVDVPPLSALRLVAGDALGIFGVQGVDVRVGICGHHLLVLGAGISGHYAFIELLHLFAR